MMIPGRAFTVVAAVMAACTCYGAEQLPAVVPVTPDLAALQETALKLCADAREPGVSLKLTEFLEVRLERQLLPRTEALPEGRAFLVKVHDHADWYKASEQHILLLVLDEAGFTPVFHYVGGCCESGLTCEARHLGAYHSSRPYSDLVIWDYSSGTGYTQEQLLIFRYDVATGRFKNVFDEMISYSHSGPGAQFSSTVEFRSVGPRDEIVVTTDSSSGEDGAAGSDDAAQSLTRVFRWQKDGFKVDPDRSDTTEPIPPGWHEFGRWYTEFPVKRDDPPEDK